MNTLMRYEPLRGLRRELEQFIDDFALDLPRDTAAVWAPRLDLSETEGAFVVRMDLPGLKAEDVQVAVQDDRLVVTGERSRETAEEREDFHRVERAYGSFFRALTLPRNTDRAGIEADFEDGVLIVTMPKTAESQPRKIEVGKAKQLVQTN